MAISLQKGGNISLSKTTPNLKNVTIGLGWDARSTSGDDFDLDASIFMVGANGKVPSDSNFIFYGQLRSACGSVEHTGDNRTGDADGDDEAINVVLDKVPSDITRLVVAVTIHEADVRRQNFGMVHNAYIRVINSDNDVELARFDLTEDASVETAMIFGEVYRHNGEWTLRAVGQGYTGGLHAMAISHGVNVQ